ncbi:MAG: hypothetical protein JHC81_03850 [Brevundimonas sp.]|uniref:hypothetical protein n=1 Tax=Brevundimonas sp. TaxID=1871086 RepID=UPI001A2F54FE|nr:hypothetical protein [Brevundimonas sp.]MBJ7446647.1 hypothetical protein [Brevundimonas sp.]
MTLPANPALLVAGAGSLAAGVVHLACIVGGPDWYRFFGAGEGMARAVEQGRWQPHVMTAVIAIVLFGWAWFAFAAAGQVPRPPLLRIGLIAITLVLLLRAAAAFVPGVWRAEHSPTFITVSSLIVLVLGLAFLIGTIKAWPTLSMRT